MSRSAQKRIRKPVLVTLSPEAIAKVDRIAGPGQRSKVIDELILEMPEPEPEPDPD